MPAAGWIAILEPMPPIALTIAGSDPSGGAGLQADLKTFHRFGVYGEAVVTLITVQNTVRVSRVELVPVDLVLEQFAEPAVFRRQRDIEFDDVAPAGLGLAHENLARLLQQRRHSPLRSWRDRPRSPSRSKPGASRKPFRVLNGPCGMGFQ